MREGDFCFIGLSQLIFQKELLNYNALGSIPSVRFFSVEVQGRAANDFIIYNYRI